MIKNSWILYLFVLLTASSSVFSQKQVEQAVDAPQNWQNGMEHSAVITMKHFLLSKSGSIHVCVIWEMGDGNLFLCPRPLLVEAWIA